MKRPFYTLLAALLFLSLPSIASADVENTLETNFATVRYAGEQELSDFFWRISGQRLSAGSADLVKNRIDELVERVEAILEMYPPRLHFTIRLEPRYTRGDIAKYSHGTRTITVAVDRVTDGVLAHEIAHAVMNVYFPVPPPERAQEILARYVDAHLFE